MAAASLGFTTGGRKKTIGAAAAALGAEGERGGGGGGGRRRDGGARFFSGSARRRQILDIDVLPDRIVPHYQQTSTSSLLALRWPQPPRNVLLMPKLHAPKVTLSAIEFARHVHGNYPGLNLVFESHVAATIHEALPFPIYTADRTDSTAKFARKIDLVTTMGGDGTILRAASLFSMQNNVPPILSFSMGTLGFLGEWKFDEYKRAWRECYMSGCPVPIEDLAAGAHHLQGPPTTASSVIHGGGWESVRGNGKCMGMSRTSKILLRNRLRVGVYDNEGRNINEQLLPTSTSEPDLGAPPLSPEDDVEQPLRSAVSGVDAVEGSVIRTPPSLHAINEISIDRGIHPHLAVLDIFVNGHFLTEAVADGILISTPTGSTAYSLSAGGSIVHPLVKSLLITPISPRSLSFRPLVLPLHTKVVLRLSKRNRGRELPVSIDGKRRVGVKIGMEVRVEGERLERTSDGWRGGVPCVIRASSRGGDGDGISEDDDAWVGGLNGLLKFNYPFGEMH
ncbi:ATP-NAD kinase-like domain-containing protein [Podospora didyma]|uniref:ATP-NAD kinase-like domain-containing protein n=1 Tax=Podospora didyma TaxID=330526 RepID=A0AAE0K4M2_9PEZI|nr:ATP-NAD kinase-like domain-containing protein [Podospora didyma]